MENRIKVGDVVQIATSNTYVVLELTRHGMRTVCMQDGKPVQFSHRACVVILPILTALEKVFYGVDLGQS